jgi:hypothetical protein
VEGLLGFIDSDRQLLWNHQHDITFKNSISLKK